MKLYFKIFLMVLFATNLYKSQEVILSLNSTKRDSITPNLYFKDVDNDYQPFIGSWKANFSDKIIMLRVIKIPKEKKTKKVGENEVKYFEDTLLVQHVIMDNSGNIIEDYFSQNLKIYKIHSQGFSKSKQKLMLFYSGVLCAVGWGRIELKMIDSKHFIWNYFPQHSYTDRCGKNEDYTVNLPEIKDLIFTKQKF